MKCFYILECKELEKISNELYTFLDKKELLKKSNLQFWNFLNKKELFDLLSSSPVLTEWFTKLKLRVREGSFTVWNDRIQTSPHVDAPPVVAKINIPVLNTKNTYNIWYDENQNEIARVECIRPIVLRSNILHTVEVSNEALLPRIQFSFCFYDEPLNYLM
jgi:hypothetical protein